MSENYSEGSALKFNQQSTLINSFMSTVSSEYENDKNYITQELQQIDKRLSRVHAPEYYDPMATIMISQTKKKLSLPKANSLTDSFMRISLGFDEKYSKSYLELLDRTQQQGQKERRIEQIKQKFSKSNKFVDVCANIKSHYTQKYSCSFKPVYGNEHQSYLKTQLIFLQKPNNLKITERQYFDKRFDQVTQKIEEIGGIEDALSKMQNSLSQNEIQNLKKKQFLLESKLSTRKNLFYMTSKKSVNRLTAFHIYQKTWLDRSRVMRQNFKQRFHIS